MTHRIYTREDCGCYADGAHGLDHGAWVAVTTAEASGWDSNAADQTEEYDVVELALDYLNAHCVEAGIRFAFVDGDLLLIEDSELAELRARDDSYDRQSGR